MLARGQAHTAVVTEDGELWVWGRGHEGQLGLKVVLRLNVATLLPSTVLGGHRVAMVSCGLCHTGCVTQTGALLTWGLGTDG